MHPCSLNGEVIRVSESGELHRLRQSDGIFVFDLC